MESFDEFYYCDFWIKMVDWAHIYFSSFKHLIKQQ